MSLNIGFIGAGNLAWQLAPALDNAGIVVRKVYNRSPKAGAALVKKLYQAEYNDNLDFSSENLDILFLSVADDFLSDLATDLVVNHKTIVVHTSGAQSIDILSDHFKHCGVFYPLQTFSRKKRVNFSSVPILVEGSNANVTSLLKKVASTISDKVKVANSDKRAHVHLAAVFASNFSNHMILLSQHILRSHKMDPELLLPLISETINKAFDLGPEQAQTGPARRKDLKTMDKHMSMLGGRDDLSEVYRIISQSILDHYS